MGPSLVDHELRRAGVEDDFFIADGVEARVRCGADNFLVRERNE